MFHEEEVVVYTKAGCQPCKATVRALNALGISYNTKAIDELTAPFLRLSGHTTAPVVFAFGESWSGFQPDKIKALKSVGNTDKKGVSISPTP